MLCQGPEVSVASNNNIRSKVARKGGYSYGNNFQSNGSLGDGRSTNGREQQCGASRDATSVHDHLQIWINFVVNFNQATAGAQVVDYVSSRTVLHGIKILLTTGIGTEVVPVGRITVSGALD